MTFKGFICSFFDLRNFTPSRGVVLFLGTIIFTILFYEVICFDIAITHCAMTNGFSEVCLPW
jgi:hypothetical protein